MSTERITVNADEFKQFVSSALDSLGDLIAQANDPSDVAAAETAVTELLNAGTSEAHLSSFAVYGIRRGVQPNGDTATVLGPLCEAKLNDVVFEIVT